MKVLTIHAAHPDVAVFVVRESRSRTTRVGRRQRVAHVESSCTTKHAWLTQSCRWVAFRVVAGDRREENNYRSRGDSVFQCHPAGSILRLRHSFFMH